MIDSVDSGKGILAVVYRYKATQVLVSFAWRRKQHYLKIGPPVPSVAQDVASVVFIKLDDSQHMFALDYTTYGCPTNCSLFTIRYFFNLKTRNPSTYFLLASGICGSKMFGLKLYEFLS